MEMILPPVLFIRHSPSLTPSFTNRITIMDLIQLVLVLIAVGVGLWLINSFIPMDSKIKQILNIVVVIVVILWLLKVFGIFDAGTIHVGK